MFSLAADIGCDDDDDNGEKEPALTRPAPALAGAVLPSRDGQVPVSVQPARVAGWAANFSSPVFSSAIYQAADDGNDDDDVDGESTRASGRYLSDETRAALFAGLGLDKDSDADSANAKDKGGDGGSLAARLRALLDETTDPFPPLSSDESSRSMMEGVSAAAAASLDDLRARYLASSSSLSSSADAADAFRSAAADATIEIGSISVDDLAAEERRMEELRVAMLQGMFVCVSVFLTFEPGCPLGRPAHTRRIITITPCYSTHADPRIATTHSFTHSPKLSHTLLLTHPLNPSTDARAQASSTARCAANATSRAANPTRARVSSPCATKWAPIC